MGGSLREGATTANNVGEALTDKAGFAGIIGSISCDGFGDCGAGVWE